MLCGGASTSDIVGFALRARRERRARKRGERSSSTVVPQGVLRLRESEIGGILSFVINEPRNSRLEYLLKAVAENLN